MMHLTSNEHGDLSLGSISVARNPRDMTAAQSRELNRVAAAGAAIVRQNAAALREAEAVKAKLRSDAISTSPFMPLSPVGSSDAARAALRDLIALVSKAGTDLGERRAAAEAAGDLRREAAAVVDARRSGLAADREDAGAALKNWLDLGAPPESKPSTSVVATSRAALADAEDSLSVIEAAVSKVETAVRDAEIRLIQIEHARVAARDRIIGAHIECSLAKLVAAEAEVAGLRAELEGARMSTPASGVVSVPAAVHAALSRPPAVILPSIQNPAVAGEHARLTAWRAALLTDAHAEIQGD